MIVIVWALVGVVVLEAAAIVWLVLKVRRWSRVVKVTPVDSETRRMRFQSRLGKIIESAGR